VLFHDGSNSPVYRVPVAPLTKPRCHRFVRETDATAGFVARASARRGELQFVAGVSKKRKNRSMALLNSGVGQAFSPANGELSARTRETRFCMALGKP
jgi:hypothetical protein